MEQIVYISTARALTISNDVIEDVLRTSRRNNQRDGLSGVLVVGGRRFLQVLEGPKPALDLAYERIKADGRHFALVELSRKPIAQRGFPGWDMAYQAGESADAFNDLAEIVIGMTERLGDPNLKAQLRSFAELHSRAA